MRQSPCRKATLLALLFIAAVSISVIHTPGAGPHRSDDSTASATFEAAPAAARVAEAGPGRAFEVPHSRAVYVYDRRTAPSPVEAVLLGDISGGALAAGAARGHARSELRGHRQSRHVRLDL